MIVFMGDSLTVGLGQNVTGIKVFATVGHTIEQGVKAHEQAILDAKPDTIVISYGTNDAGHNEPSVFKNNMIVFIKSIKNALPGIKVYVNKIFPGDSTKATGTTLTCIENIPAYNNVLSQVASEAGATLIDCTNIPDLKTYYSSDGIHFKGSFYKLWYDEMLKKIESSDGNTPADPSTVIKQDLLPASFNGKFYSTGPITPQWIVIHNTAGGTAKSNRDWFHSGQQPNTSAHFTSDDKEVYQLLQLNWKGHHTSGSGQQWTDNEIDASGCSNSNSIGIEIADGNTVDHNKAIEIAIELTRYLMKELNIDVAHVVRHGDTQAKPCPATIMEKGKWPYFKEQLKVRNEANTPIDIGGAIGGGGGGIGGGIDTSVGSGTALYGTPTDIEVQLPDVDHRENTYNMDNVTGLSFTFYPPYTACETFNKDEHFAKYNWDRTYHFIIGKETASEDSNIEADTESNDEIAPAIFSLTRSNKKIVFVGDSLFVDLKNNVSGLTVFAEDELTIAQAIEKYEQDIVNSNPDIIIWYIGSDSAGLGDPNTFAGNLNVMFNSHKTLLPNTQIYICKLFPGDESKATGIRLDIVKNIPSYNNAIIDIAAKNEIPVLDCTDIPNLLSYYKDNSALLFKDEFYPLWYDELMIKIGEKENSPNDPNDPNDSDSPDDSGSNLEGDPVGGDKILESVEGFQIKATLDEKRQSKGFTDNDIHTYIDRALFSNKKERHCLTVALCCPENTTDYPTYEKALIEGLSILLHEHALEMVDLWREFDLNRAASPLIYLDRDCWKDLLVEVQKQLDWRVKKFGKYTKTYTPYSAGSSGLSGGGTGSININGGIGPTPGGSITGPNGPGTGTTLESEDEVANIAYKTLVGLGLSIEAACGVLGNIYQESGMKPTAVNSSSGATGLCQWLGGRLTGLKNYAASKGTDWTDVATQIEWAWMECEGKDSTTKKLLDKNCGGPEGFKTLGLEQAVDIWRKCFERCGEHEANDARRLKMAKEYYSKVNSGSIGGSDDSSSGDIDSGLLTPASIQPRDNVIDNSGAGSTNNSAATSNSNIFGWPLPGISKVSSKFGPRTPPCPGASSFHGGIDVGAASGTSIKAYAAGTVVQNVAWNKSAGNYIKIDHGNGVASRYLHMVEPSPLKVGDTVTAGQEVGKVGNTGVGTGPHLHFEIHINGEKVDPLKYVNPGGGTIDNPNINPGTGGVIDNPGGSNNISVSIGGDSENLLYEDKKMANTNAPIGDNSAGGQDHNDWGGTMTYKKGEPEDPNAEQPEILNIITQEMYEELIKYADFKLVDDYVQEFEPYSKGLAKIDENMITVNDRINAMTKKFTTSNEVTFHYKVIESGPGSKDHCVTIAEELNYIAVPQDIKVEPIYPDLVVPPGYVTTDNDKHNQNGIPIATLKQSSIATSDAYTKQISFDYDLLKDKVKFSDPKLHPANYADPFPYDEKIQDLEKHFPKVLIDEIEGQLYSCNHPGCPISQPMAKNFAMISDAFMNQSKRTEQRLSRIENNLATVMRYLGRLGGRVNINCVYYGGCNNFGKYRTVRCLHDDRITDGGLCTIDQCLNCTRFEPVLGQVYRILDDAGLNGSIILDDMQMSYTDLEGYRNLNDITHRSSKYYNAMCTNEDNCIKPEKTLEDIWKEADKQLYIQDITEDIEDETERQNLIDNIKEEDYVFKMDWAETYHRTQEPDTKLFHTEGIVARQKGNKEEVGENNDGIGSLEAQIAELDPVLDADVIEYLEEQIKVRDNIWVDTRDIADYVQSNKYSSENFFFEDFNKVRIGKYGIRFHPSYGYNGEDYNNIYAGAGSGSGSGSGSNGSTGFASDVRNKIVQMAEQIFKDCQDGKAWYNTPSPRTVEYNNPQTLNGKTVYDCTGFVSCCYMNAGLKSMYSKSCSGGSLIQEILNGGEMWICNDTGVQSAKPGDVLVRATSTVSESQMGSFIDTEHAMIYVGNGKIIHAKGKKYGIVHEELGSRLTDGRNFFVRPADLIEADKQAAQMGNGSTGSVTVENGTIDGQSYVAKIPGAVCTSYYGDSSSASGMPLVNGSVCASHNLPYGTKIYIPSLKDLPGKGIVTVVDTGGPLFDFDIYSSSSLGKEARDAYVLEWGTGKISWSYTEAIDFYVKKGTWNTYTSAWNMYKNMGGKLIGFLKFSDKDQDIKNHPQYNS